MTKSEAFALRKPNFNGEVDFALPQNWVDNLVKFSKIEYDRIVSQFCWIYEDNDIFGKAFALTEDADWIRIKHHQFFR